MSQNSNPKGLPKVSITNRQRRIKIERSALLNFGKEVLPQVLQNPGPNASDLVDLPQVDFYLVNDAEMSRLHEEFSGVPGPTDILTFQHGEVFISVDTAAAQAAEFGNELDRELRIYLVHGLLHLHGHDDHEPGEAAEMNRLQELLVPNGA